MKHPGTIPADFRGPATGMCATFLVGHRCIAPPVLFLASTLGEEAI